MSKKPELKVLGYNEALDSLKENDSFLFVRNIAKPVGNLNFVVTDSSGMRRTVSIRCDTFIPIDISIQATKESILTNPEFKRYWSIRALEIIDSNSALEAIKSNPRYSKENERITSSEAIDISSEPEVPVINAEVVEGAIVDADPFVQNLILDEDNSDAESIINNLESRLDSLELKDLEYIESTSKLNEVKEWAKENKNLFE